MPRRKTHESNSHERDPNADTPTMQDEADILAEAGAEPDETGELVVDQETIRELGAVDATSVRENRRLSRVMQKKREGKKDVPFNTKDPVVIYGTLLGNWTPDSIDITVKRLLGGATTMLNKPINGAALYDAIMHFHGQHAETEYEIKFTSSGKYMGIGRITMPDTRSAAQQGQPMQQPYGAQPLPGYFQPAPQPQPYGYPPQQVISTPPPIGSQPTPLDPMAMMQQMFQMFRQMQSEVQPAPQPQPQYQAPPMMPPMPSPQSSPAEMMAWMQQAFGMFQQMQGGVPRPAQVAAPPPPVPSPMAPQPNPLEQMREMFSFFRDMQTAMAPRPVPRAFDPQGGERPPYARPPYAPGAPQPPQRPPTMAETFRESISVVRSAVDMMQEMEGVLPGREAQEAHSSPEDDDSPVRVIDTGPAKIVVNKSDGSTRLWETGVANMDKIFKWVGEQREAIQRESAARQYRQHAPQQQQLPLVDREDELPPPPSQVPPSIETPPRAAWGAPTVPSDEQGEDQ